MSVFDKFECQVQSTSAQMAAVIWMVRRHRRNERTCWEPVFTTCVNIFGMTKEKIIQTYGLWSQKCNTCQPKLPASLLFLAFWSLQHPESVAAAICQSRLSQTVCLYIKFLSTRDPLSDDKCGVCQREVFLLVLLILLLELIRVIFWLFHFHL